MSTLYFLLILIDRDLFFDPTFSKIDRTWFFAVVLHLDVSFYVYYTNLVFVLS